MPGWYDWCFAFAAAMGLGGAIALLLRRGAAVSLLVLSLVGVTVQFGYLFATSDIIAVKGVWTTYFPLLIVAVCLGQILFARTARARGWIG